MGPTAWRGIKEQWFRFSADTSGLALIYVTIALPVIIGFALLAVDVGRLWSLQSSLQHGADALALAGGGELDRRSDAIIRANRAIANLLSNPTTFATSVATIDGSNVDVRYFSAIPGHGMPGTDADPMPTGPGLDVNIATDNIAARFVEVTVTPIDFNTIFPASFLGASNTARSSAMAVAGFDAAVCQFTPMFVCNPYEASTNLDPMDSTELMKHFDRVNYPDRIGRLINMKQTGGNTAQYFPGNFGFLQPQPPYNPGANDLRELIGLANPPACFIQSGVELRTGAIESVRFGFNTRFDMYNGPMSSNKNNPLFRPARNVRKGLATDKNNGQGSPCNPDTLANVNDASKLLPDTCFNSNTCPYMGGRMGDGVWDKATYWSRSHNGAALPGPLQGQYITRYDVYRYEVDTAGDLDIDSNSVPLLGGEIGRPGCYTGGSSTINDNPDRRIFHGAILNCRALDNPINGGPIQGGSSGSLPVIAFVQFFITQPMGGDPGDASAADGDVWAEMVGIDAPGNTNSVARDIVQLFR